MAPPKRLITETARTTTTRGNPEYLRHARTSAGVSLRGLAREAGVTAPYIVDLEKGRRNLTPERLTDFESAIQRLRAARKEPT